MKTLKIIEKDRLGLLMDISYILGKEKINIENISATSVKDKAIILLQVRDEKRVAQILKKNGFNVIEDDSLILRLEDRPGELAKISKMLADNSISVDNLYIVSKDKKHTYVSIAVDRPRKARRILKDYLLEEQV